MVRRQGSRFGVSTNHSIRRSNVATSQQDVTQFVVVKTMSKQHQLTAKGNKRILSEFSHQFQDGNLAMETDDTNPSPILYSLNKHRRWELPEMIKENILEEENHTESRYQLSLSERHIGGGTGTSIHSGDCIGVCQSKITPAQRLPKQCYAFGSDLKGSTTRPGKGRRRKGRKNQGEEEADGEDEVEEVLPEIHYEVCYPRPKDRYQYSSKANKGHAETVTVKSGKKKSSKKNCTLNWMGDHYDNLDDEFEEEFASPESWYEDGFYDAMDSETVSLGDVLVTLLIDAVCAEKTNDDTPVTKRKRHRSKKNSVSSQDNSDNDTKNHIEFVDMKDAERFQPQEDEPVFEDRNSKQKKKKARNQPQARARRRNNNRGQNPPAQPPTPQPIPPVIEHDLKVVRKISMNSLRSTNLHGSFADCYHEGHCQPRRFVINLKPSVEEHLKETGHERTAMTLKESPHQIMLVFEPFGCVEGVIGSKTPAYKQVRFEQVGFPQELIRTLHQSFNWMNSCWCSTDTYPWSSVKMKSPTLGASEEEEAVAKKHTSQCTTHVWSVQELVKIFKKGFGKVEPGSFYRSDGAISWVAKHPTVTLETVQSVTRIEWQTSTPDAIFQNAQSNAVAIPTSKPADKKPTNCGICYESLLTSVHVLDASALTACGHWFCNECWTQHLRSRVKQGDINIICPEFDCDTPVDKVILLSYLTPKEYRAQTFHTRNTTLNSQPEWKWCPNTACGRLVKTTCNPGSSSDSDGGGVSINCDCGVLWCSSCKGEGHWPATCEQAAAYWKLIMKNGSVRWKLFSPVGDITHVRVKKCPFCRNLIEKQDGCNYMYCICKRAFCWDCLQDYENHDYNLCRNNAKSLQKVKLVESKPVMISMPGIALQHRERRTRFAVMRRRKAAEILAKKAFLIRQGRLYEAKTKNIEQSAAFKLDHTSPPLGDDDTGSIASSSSSLLSVSSTKRLPLTWMQDNESSWQLVQDILKVAENVAKFCSEAEFCLEYLEVLLNDPNTELRSPDTLWNLKDRLIFIADQLHMILHGEIKVNADSAMDRVTILMHAGKKCLKWIAANVPRVLAASQDDEDEDEE